MSPLFWLDVAAYGVAVMGAVALALMVLGTGPTRRRNLLFALFALSEAVWALSSIFLRLTLWLKMGSPAFALELATVAFAALGIFLLMFTVRYVQRPSRWVDLASGIGAAVTAILSIFVFRHQILYEPRLVANDMPFYEVSTWGFAAALIPMAFLVWSLVLFWQERRRTAEWYLAGSVVILLAGFLFGGLFSLPFPIMSITTSISIAVLGYGVISRQLLNPLRQMTAELEQKVRERTQELEELVARERKHQVQLQTAMGQIEKQMANEQAQRAQLQQLVDQVRATASHMSSTAAEMLATASQQAAGASQQSAAITQAMATIAQVRTISEHAAASARGVATRVQRTADVSQSGQKAVADSIAGMEQVRLQVEAIAAQVANLAEQTEAIAQITAMAAQIANQSRVLALNAAVEAARAGEAGRGFTVVAGEVRNLADQSHTATEQIRDILGETQRGVSAAAAATAIGQQGTAAGVQLTAQAGEAIQQLAAGVNESAQAADLIAVEAGQQLAGIEQISRAMENIHQVTVQTAAAARQVERAAAELNGLAGQLREQVG